MSPDVIVIYFYETSKDRQLGLNQIMHKQVI